MDLGATFARRLQPGDVVALLGDLGSGKTCFTRGVCAGLGVREHVASPTFVLMNVYHGLSLTVYHFDFYRITTLRQVRDLGFEEFLIGSGVCIIEWAERAAELLPVNRFDVRFDLGENENERLIRIAGGTEVPRS